MLDKIIDSVESGKAISEREALTAILEVLLEINTILNKIAKKK